MGITNFKNGISSFGVPVLPGAGGDPFMGNVGFVDSGHSDGSDSPSAGTKTAPWSTMNYADSQMTANNGDVVYVMPGHIETVIAAAGLELDKAGVMWRAIGYGSDRPTINFTTDVAADMDIGAVNIFMSNFLITGGIDNLTAVVDVNAADFGMQNCEIRDVTGKIAIGISADANADRMRITGLIYRGSSSAGATAAIQLIGGDDITVKGFMIDGNFTTAGISNISTDVVDCEISEGKVRNRASEVACISMNSDSASGWLGRDLDLRTNGGDPTTAMANTGGMTLIHRIEVVNNAGNTSKLPSYASKYVGLGNN